MILLLAGVASGVLAYWIDLRNIQPFSGILHRLASFIYRQVPVPKAFSAQAWFVLDGFLVGLSVLVPTVVWRPRSEIVPRTGENVDVDR